MYRVALVLNGVVQYIGTYEGLPQFAYPSLAVDITNYDGDVREGYTYDAASGVFTESTPPIPEEPEEPIIPEPEPTPEPEPPETLEDKIARLESTTEMNSLITIDAVLGVYEEVLALREEVAELKANS